VHHLVGSQVEAAQSPFGRRSARPGTVQQDVLRSTFPCLQCRAKRFRQRSFRGRRSPSLLRQQTGSGRDGPAAMCHLWRPRQRRVLLPSPGERWHSYISSRSVPALSSASSQRIRASRRNSRSRTSASCLFAATLQRRWIECLAPRPGATLDPPTAAPPSPMIDRAGSGGPNHPLVDAGETERQCGCSTQC